MMTKYTVIGAGAMGLRYGVLIQERTGNPVDFIDTGTKRHLGIA